MKNKWVLITGSSRGLGKYLALEFAKAGYSIILHGTKQTSHFNETFKQVKEYKVGLKKVFADFSNERELTKLKKIIDSLRPEILINNAALYQGDVFKQISINLSAPIVITDYFCKKSKKGIIVNINSMAGNVPNFKEAVYCASKFGLRGFSESVKYEMLKQGIRIIDLYPGAINIGMSSHREDRDKLIDPEEFSKFVCALIKTKSFVANNVSIARVK